MLKAESTGPSDSVQWQTVYDQLDEDGSAILRESQIWTMHERDGQYVLDLQWTGEALTEIMSSSSHDRMPSTTWASSTPVIRCSKP